MNKLKLDDIINAIEFHSDEWQSFIDLKNNKVCIISDETLSIASVICSKVGVFKISSLNYRPSIFGLNASLRG